MNKKRIVTYNPDAEKSKLKEKIETSRKYMEKQRFPIEKIKNHLFNNRDTRITKLNIELSERFEYIKKDNDGYFFKIDKKYDFNEKSKNLKRLYSLCRINLTINNRYTSHREEKYRPHFDLRFFDLRFFKSKSPVGTDMFINGCKGIFYIRRGAFLNIDEIDRIIDIYKSCIPIRDERKEKLKLLKLQVFI